MTTTTVTTAICVVPGAYTVSTGLRGTFVLNNAEGVTVHRYGTRQGAERAAALHAHPQACKTCLHGCDCDVTIPSHGCGHHGCWGQSASDHDPCTFAAIVRAAR